MESCNITAAKDTLLKLHYEVIDGLLQRAPSDQDILGSKVALASQISDVDTAKEKPAKIQPAPARTSQPVPEAIGKLEKSSDNGFTWFGTNKYDLIVRLITINCFLFLVGLIFVVMRKRS